MTLVRKGLLSAKGLHYGYTASLLSAWFVGLRSCLYTQSLDFPIMMAVGYGLYKLRRRGLNKYLIWIPVIMARILIGDKFISYSAW
jgi:hypothetical protein